MIPVSEADRFTTRRGVYMELRSVDLRETGKGHQPLCGDLWGGRGGLNQVQEEETRREGGTG